MLISCSVRRVLIAWLYLINNNAKRIITIYLFFLVLLFRFRPPLFLSFSLTGFVSFRYPTMLGIAKNSHNREKINVNENAIAVVSGDWFTMLTISTNIQMMLMLSSVCWNGFVSLLFWLIAREMQPLLPRDKGAHRHSKSDFIWVYEWIVQFHITSRNAYGFLVCLRACLCCLFSLPLCLSLFRVIFRFGMKAIPLCWRLLRFILNIWFRLHSFFLCVCLSLNSDFISIFRWLFFSSSRFGVLGMR